MRLIDEDDLTKGRVENDPVVIAAKCAPIAYDPEKVVAQLEEHFNATNDKGAMINNNTSIKIVKGGGVDE